MCAPGTFQDEKRMTSCKKCPEGRYTVEEGAAAQAQCTFCPPDRTTGSVTGASRITSCLCKAQAYFQQDTDVYDESSKQLPDCTVCPKGAECPIDGTRRIHLYARHNFWQPENETTKFIDCASAFTDATLSKIARARCCPPEAHCDRVPRSSNWTTDEQCAVGYSG